jgi:hypothetical protein
MLAVIRQDSITTFPKARTRPVRNFTLFEATRIISYVYVSTAREMCERDFLYRPTP